MINIELLRSKVPEPSKSKDGKSTIASLDGTAEGVGAAIIVAAAFHSHKSRISSNGHVTRLGISLLEISMEGRSSDTI